MTKFCKTRVPQDLEEGMEARKEDANAIKEYGIEYGAQMCREIMAAVDVKALHFYTLNLEKVVYGILEKLGMVEGVVADESDANTMAAVGSAWARVGDRVSSVFGEGIVSEIRQTGAAVIRLDSWHLAGGQFPTAFLERGQYKKVFA